MVREQRPQRAERSSDAWSFLKTLILPKGPIVPMFTGCVSHCIQLLSLLSFVAVSMYALALALPLEVLLPGNEERLKALDVKLSKRRRKESWQTSGVLWARLNLYQKSTPRRWTKLGREQQ